MTSAGSEPEFFEARLPEVTLRCARMGDPSKPLILCLHGFPEYWAAWRAVMEQLADGFCLVAPDQRGYNRSAKPPAVDDYRASRLVADIAALADQLSPARPFRLAGHDWGASVAYAYAFAHPGRLTHLVIVNGVHPACFQRAIIEDGGQRRASQYIHRLRAPEADRAMAENGFARTFRMLSGFSRTEWMGESERAAYLDAWSQPGAMPAMLNWYRASPLVVPAMGEEAPPAPVLAVPADRMTVRVPHLVIWGEGDEALRPSCLEGLDAFAPDLTVRRVADAGHWILHEKPDAVAAAIREFVGESANGG